MSDGRPPRPRASTQDRVRDLGYDPTQLTPREQRELLEWRARAPDGAPPGAEPVRIPLA